MIQLESLLENLFNICFVWCAFVVSVLFWQGFYSLIMTFLLSSYNSCLDLIALTIDHMPHAWPLN